MVHWNIQTGEYIKYTSEHGLASNFVTSIAQSDDGAIWFGTYGAGVSRFDGHKWTTFTTSDGLEDNIVNCILAARNGTIWFGTYYGISSYDGRDWVSFSYKNGYPIGTVDVIAETPDRKLWFGNSLYGLTSYAEGQWYTVNDLPENSATALAVSPDGSLWVGAMEHIMHWNGHAWESFPVNGQVSSIAVSPDGTVWVGYSLMKTLDMVRESLDLSRLSFPGVSRYDGKEWTDIKTDAGLPENEIRSIQVDRDGAIWFGSFSQGVSRYDKNGWHRFVTTDEICSNYIKKVIRTQNSLLLAYPGGIASFDEQRWHCLREIGNLTSGFDVFSTSIDPDEKVWFGMDDGIAAWDGENWITYGRKEYPSLWLITAIALLPDGSHLVASGSSIYKFDGEKLNKFQELDYGVDAIQVLEDGSIWLGSRNGLYFIDGKKLDQHIRVGGPDDPIEALSIGLDGSLWIASCTNGITRFKENRWKTYFKSNGLADICVLGLAVSQDGNIWAGTTDGLSVFDGSSWKSFRTQEGLADNYIQDVIADPDGTIWIATHAGLSHFFPPSR